MICDIYAADSTTRLARIKRIPQPDGYGLFDLHRILEKLCHVDINAAVEGFVSNTKSFYGYIIKFGEEYGTDPAQYLDLATDSKRYVYNAIFDFVDFTGYNQADWLMAGSVQKKFLTNAPRTLFVRPGTNAWLHFMTDTNIVSKLTLKTYDSAGTIAHTLSLANSLTDMTNDADRFLRVPAGLPMRAQLSILPGMPALASIPCSWKTAAVNAVSETFTFYINTKTTKYSWYRLHFLNKMGGFDSFDFRQVSRTNLDISRNFFKKYTGAESAGAWNYGASERGYTQYDKK